MWDRVERRRGGGSIRRNLLLGTAGVTRGGSIGIRSGRDSADELHVNVHELDHKLLHRGDDRLAGKTVREIEAVGFVVGRADGLDAVSTADSADCFARFGHSLHTGYAALAH